MDGWDRMPKKWWKKKGLQKSRYLVAQAKASKQKGRKEGREVQLSTELACSICTLLKCNMKKGKRKKDPSREGGTKGGLFGFWPNTPYKCVHPVGLFSWVWGKGIWNDTLTVIMWTPYHLQKSQQQKTRKHPKRRQRPLLCYVLEKMGLSEKLVPTKVSCKMDDVWMRNTFSSIFLFHS
jgi:hypothetical protein